MRSPSWKAVYSMSSCNLDISEASNQPLESDSSQTSVINLTTADFQLTLEQQACNSFRTSSRSQEWPVSEFLSAKAQDCQKKLILNSLGYQGDG